MPKANIPEIRIQFSYLLQNGVSSRLDKFHNPEQSNLSSFDQAAHYTSEYKKAWKKHEKTILNGLIERTELNFYLPVIDVSLADYIIPMSNPLILHFRNEPDQFVDVLTHELIHVLLTDNQYYQTAASDFNLRGEWGKLFGKHDFKTLIHIPVHALLKYVYLDVLGEKRRQKRDIEHAKKIEGADAYVKAWDYIENHDYQEIIDKTVGVYSRL